MRRVAALLILAVLPLASRGAAAAAQPTGFVAGAALVRFAPGTPQAIIAAAHARAGAHVVRTIPVTGYQQVAFDPSLPQDAVLASYRNDPSVAIVEPDYIGAIASAPNDPCVAGPCAGQAAQWALAMTNARAAWAGGFLTSSSKATLPRVTVAVLDTKIDLFHPDFANTGSSSTDAVNGGQIDVAGAKDWIPSSQQAGAAAYHGTYVAGLVAAATNNATAVASIGSRATILPLTIVDGSGKADAASLADAIVYAWQRGARIINLSLGLTSDSQAVHDAIRAATGGAHPALVVAAAGNNTGSTAFYPGSYPEVMSVAGTNPADGNAVCSNYNGNVSVSAPADHVVSLSNDGTTVAPPCGTSAAAPQVSGLAADLFAQDPSRTPAAVRSIIERSADDLGAAGRDDRFGYGRINADRALAAANLPVTTLPRTTVPPATGGGSALTATATSSSGKPITAARLFVDSLDSTPVALHAADGSFGGTTESLAGTIAVASNAAVGPHPIYVQAFDGTQWGPAAIGVLLVDAKPPAITSPSATNAVRATGQPVNVGFTLSDDASTKLIYGIQVFDSTNHEVYRYSKLNVPLGATSYSWMPAPAILPGQYQVKIIAVDESGKSSATMVGAVVA